jgi:CRISPR/Cas system-associated exonuclease Cas4 (RecB family)
MAEKKVKIGKKTYILPDIIELVDEVVEDEIVTFPCHSNRASAIGHDCMRYLVYERTQWQNKQKHSVDLQYIFDEGHDQEKAVKEKLKKTGLELTGAQDFQEYKPYKLTSHVDIFIFDPKYMNRKTGEPLYTFPVEIKSIAPHGWEVIDGVESIRNSKNPWVRRYLGQMTIYLLNTNREIGVIVFKNKSTGRLKVVWMQLDYDYAETLVKKADAINKHVEDETLPDRIPYDGRQCDECSYVHICCPAYERSELELMTDPELEDMIEGRDQLKPYKSKHDALDKEIKARIGKRTKLVVGKFFVAGKEVEKKEYTVKAGKSWKLDIKPLEKVKIKNVKE